MCCAKKIDLFNEKFSLIEFKIEFNTKVNQELLINLRKLKEQISKFTQFMVKYNYQDVESNGYYSFHSICVQFEELILTQLSNNKFHRINDELVEISKILLVCANVLNEMQESPNKGESCLI
jgi:hypothetical protein